MPLALNPEEQQCLDRPGITTCETPNKAPLHHVRDLPDELVVKAALFLARPLQRYADREDVDYQQVQDAGNHCHETRTVFRVIDRDAQLRLLRQRRLASCN